MPHKDLPPVSARTIARVAERAAVVFAVNGWTWAAHPLGSGDPYVPGAGDIALEIHRRLADLEPGERDDSGRLVVEWELDALEPADIRVFVDLGELYTVPDEEDL